MKCPYRKETLGGVEYFPDCQGKECPFYEKQIHLDFHRHPISGEHTIMHTEKCKKALAELEVLRRQRGQK